MSCFAILLGLPLLTLMLYFSYCWGMWGRSSLLLQYYFQCKCPPASEQARYPKEAEILFSACRYTYSELSPSGRFLLVSEDKSGNVTYLLNLQTMEKTPTQSVSSFLTDEIAFIEDGLEDIIIDLFTERQYPIQTFRHWQPNAYIGGKPDLELLVDTLQGADEIYLTESYATVIVLMPEFPTNMEKSFTFDKSDIPNPQQFLILNNIRYKAIPESYPREVVSPDGRFIARDDGIYLAKTNQKITEDIHRLFVRGWANDGSGAIYTSYFLEPCLLRLALPMGDDSWCEIRVPQPVIRLKVPEEYLSSVLQ
jgi:hypothetical protein